jgi:hypothetical protein
VFIFQVLHPCDIEFVKSFKSVEDGLKVAATVSTIDVHLSASTVHTVNNVSNLRKNCSRGDDRRYSLVYVELLLTKWLSKSKKRLYC